MTEIKKKKETQKNPCLEAENRKKDLRESNSIQRKIETQTSDSIWHNDHQGTSWLYRK